MPAARLRRALAPRLASLASGLLGGPGNMLGITKVGAYMKRGGLRWSLRSLRYATVGYAHSRSGRVAALRGLRSLASPAPIYDSPRTRGVLRLLRCSRCRRVIVAVVLVCCPLSPPPYPPPLRSLCSLPGGGLMPLPLCASLRLGRRLRSVSGRCAFGSLRLRLRSPLGRACARPRCLPAKVAVACRPCAPLRNKREVQGDERSLPFCHARLRPASALRRQAWGFLLFSEEAAASKKTQNSKIFC